MGRQGIDGLYVKRSANGNIKEIIFSEVKHGKGNLGTIQNPKFSNDKSKRIKQMSKEWKIIKLDEKIDSLVKRNSNKPSDLKHLRELREIKSNVLSNSPKIKSHLTRVTNLGDGKFTININKLNENGTLGAQLKHKFQDSIIDLKARHYKKGSIELKMQKILKHAQRKQIKLKKEMAKLKMYQNKRNEYSKGTKRYNNYDRAIKRQEMFVRKIENSQPKNSSIQTKIAKKSKAVIPSKSIKVSNAIIRTKGKRTVALMSAKSLKRIKKFKNAKFLKHVKGSAAILLTVESGIAVYSVLKGGKSFKSASTLLLKNNASSLASEVLRRGVIYLTPPPAGTIVFVAVAGYMIAEYSIDKYHEAEKRAYVGLDDMFWDVPDDIRHKITGLNLEDIQESSILDNDAKGKSILENNADGNTILDNYTDDKTTILD